MAKGKERLIRGKDGLFRTVTLKAQKGRLSRPVQRLPSLEASTTQFVTDESGGEETSYGETSSKPPTILERWGRYSSSNQKRLDPL